MIRGRPGRVGDAALHERFLAMCRRSGRDVLVRQVRAIMARADSRPDLPHLDLSLLVLCGRQDAITPRDGHEKTLASHPVPGWSCSTTAGTCPPGSSRTQ
jgi:pimeloyl-ACP methyl ester carboxylesterase